MKESPNKNAVQYFESVLKTNNRNIEALFGKAKYFELCGNYDDAKGESVLKGIFLMNLSSMHIWSKNTVQTPPI